MRKRMEEEMEELQNNLTHLRDLEIVLEKQSARADQEKELREKLQVHEDAQALEAYFEF